MDQPDGEQYTDEPGDEQESLTGPDDAPSATTAIMISKTAMTLGWGRHPGRLRSRTS